MTAMQLLAEVTVIPVVVVEDVADAVPLARALVDGGLSTIEVTLRTPVAPDAIRVIRAEVPDAVVGAGTIVSAAQIDAALTAGASFLVTPGSTPVLLDALRSSGAPFLPGVASASDAIALLERDITFAKLFPAVASGGTGLLRALHGPFAQMRFCPTGGIGQHNAPEYLALPNVSCVAGSWMVPGNVVRARDWAQIERLARTAAQLVP